ncbi:MAG TPA: hypothetical protein ENJ78_00980, partial [candidate division WWE3 bacterium]|nr:hypothetical protein [candidate division WWE3 bacterium]
MQRIIDRLFSKESYFLGLLLFIFLLVFLSPFNHKELFYLIRWNVFPARIVLSFSFFLGVSLLILFKKKTLDINFILFSILSISILISSLKSSNYVDSLLYSVFYLTLPFLYLIFKFLFIHYKRKFYLSFLFVFFISSFISSLFQFYQIWLYYSRNILFGAVWPLKDSTPRFGSLFWDVNHFAVFMVISIWVSILLLYHFFRAEKPNLILRISYILFIFFSFLLLVVSLYLSSSRSAFFGLLLGFSFVGFFLLYFKKSYYKVLYLVPLLLFLLLFLFYLTPFKYFNSLRSLFVYRSESLFSHFKLLSIGVTLFLKNPVFGVGIGNFSSALKVHPSFEVLSFLDPSVL